MTISASVENQELRRTRFTNWLLRAWDWATEYKHQDLAEQLRELVDHAGESDYPLWEVARRRGIIGDSKDADLLREACGLPVMTAQPTSWEREINFSPVISLDPSVFNLIYSALGWANRDVDKKYPRTNFFLWSNAGNVVRFVKREPVVMESEEASE
jgi:hypothetical protein